MRQLRILFGFVCISAAAAGTYFAISRPDDSQGPVFRGHVMDRRCRGGCAISQQFIAALLMILPNGPAANIQGIDAGLYTDAGVKVVVVRDSGTYCADASGTLRWLGNDTACIEASGFLMESGGASNSVASPRAIGNADWFVEGSGVSAPTASLNSADVLAPDGTHTATKIVYPATTAAGQFALAYQSTSGGHIASVYALAGSGPHTFYINTDNPAAYGSCVPLDAGWTRCFAVCPQASCQYIMIGSDTRVGDANEPVMDAQTVYLWGADYETDAPSTPPWPTSYTDTNRAPETATVTNPLTDAGVFCAGVTFTPEGTSWLDNGGAHTQGLIQDGDAAGTGVWGMYLTTSSPAGIWNPFATDLSADQTSFTTTNPVSFAPHRYVMRYSGTSTTFLVDGTAAVGTYSDPDGYAGDVGAQLSPLEIGLGAYGWFNNIRADTSLANCQ